MQMSERNRLPPPAGRLIDRNRPAHFHFEGKIYTGFAGDCVASALAAADRWVLSRSFKYHRPRGILTMAGQDANTLVQLRNDPNALADRVPIESGLEVRGQNYRGSLERDRDAFVGLLARFLPVGFYYKAFYRPRGVWNYWARYFRRKTGLGVINESFRPDGFDKQYLHCDVLVVGGGRAGMTAACEAAMAGHEVVLVDENPELGGALNYLRIDAAGERAAALRADLVARVAGQPKIRVLTNATANGWFADHWVPIIQARRMYKLRAGQVVLCTGVLEQHAVFRNNDLPGVIMSTAAQRLLRLYGVRPGRRAVVLTGNDQGYAVALDLLEAGVDVTAIVEMRSQMPDAPMATAVRSRGVSVHVGHAVYAAHPGRRKDHIAQVEIRRIVAQGICAAKSERLDCDLLCMSVGFVPCYQLACQAGARLNYDDETAAFGITDLPRGMRLAGAVDGRRDLDGGSSNFRWPIFAHPRGKEFVDFDEDLQIADILNSVHEGYDNVQLVKRYSTCGMGPSQGRHSALAMARLVARASGTTVAQTGVTTARPPFAAEKLAHCAGRSFYPASRSSMHHRHVEAGAQWLQVGNWYRPAWYGAREERDDVIRREARRVRNGVGLIDVSTLGGIDIRGPDAGEFLDRIYTMGLALLPVGKARYALMTNEAGVVIDDGVACRFSHEHFYVTATTGGVGRVFQSMLKWQAQWRLDIDVANVTAAWCGVNLAGPDSRCVLERLCTDVDLSAQAFPYMGVRSGRVAGIVARLIRVGFVGELGFEIHVPQHSGEALWDAVTEAGHELGIGAFGVEAQRLLRLEKGHVIIGQDTDAMSNPRELGMQRAISKKKPFFVGQRTLDELARRPLQRRLIGFAIRDADAPVPAESHLVIEDGKITGRVTSVCFSETLGHVIGLAYVSPRLARPDMSISIRCTAGAMVDAQVVKLPFYDPDGARQSL